MKTSIYVLIDPRSNEVRYVGKTCMELHRRFKKHYCPSSLRLRTRIAYWIKHLREQGLKPIMRVIEVCEDETWEAAERWWIKYYREIGIDLVNLTDGGEGGGVKGRTQTAVTRAKISAANKGKIRTPEMCAKMASWTGRKHSAETREKMRVKATGRFLSPDKHWVHAN